MKQPLDKLKDALMTISAECASHTLCSSCPLSISYNLCGVTGQNHGKEDGWKTKPCKWRLPEIKLIAPMED